MINILEYKDIQKFLHDYWELKRKQNPAFTIRAWAIQMGMPHHTPLYEMIKGKRKVYTSFVPLFINSFKLNDLSANHLKLLVDIQRAKNELEKNLHMMKLNQGHLLQDFKILVHTDHTKAFETELAAYLEALQAKYANPKKDSTESLIRISY